MNRKQFELIKAIVDTKIELENASRNFEFAEAEMIDYYVYQIKANKSKLDYLIKKVKSQGIVIDMLTELNIKKHTKTAI